MEVGEGETDRQSVRDRHTDRGTADERSLTIRNYVLRRSSL